MLDFLIIQPLFQHLEFGPDKIKKKILLNFEFKFILQLIETLLEPSPNDIFKFQIEL